MISPKVVEMRRGGAHRLPVMPAGHAPGYGPQARLVKAPSRLRDRTEGGHPWNSGI